METHHFGAGTFAHELWIANKQVFPACRGAAVEFTSAGPFDWVFADANGVEVKTDRRENAHGGWQTTDLPSLGLHGAHSVGFRNAGTGQLVVKQGDVTFG